MKIIQTLLLFTVILSACAPASAPAAPTLDANAASTQAVATVMAGLTQIAEFVPPTEIPTETPVPTPTAIRTPPALPPTFTTNVLNPLDTPHTYINDTCQYLRAKWDPANATPGTLVMVIMFHSITKGEVTAYDQISVADFRKLMKDLKEFGFEAIDMQQMSDFVYNNAKIPERSVLLIVDDRKYREYFDTTFAGYYKDWGWKVVNAWISHPETNQLLWDENAAIEAEGWVDHQAHGVIHNINMSNDSTDEFLKGELLGSIEAQQQHFNKTPIAIIWPGGGFGIRPAQAARQYGYQLGFTINPRGPVMYNWVPLAEAADPQRPSFIPEGPVADPLMTLPRYWDSDARAHLDELRIISKSAIEYEQSVKATELEYYDIVCAPSYGVLP